MYTNLADTNGDGFNSGPADPYNVGGFASDFYWSSSEVDSFYASSQYFVDGYQSSTDYLKDLAFRVRAVRAF